ncbi:MAG: nucleotide exchange factor GrpE [Bacillota bacterium]|nr:nucleotide exchange factor GrpE [Bacillota bacterium]
MTEHPKKQERRPAGPEEPAGAGAAEATIPGPPEAAGPAEVGDLSQEVARLEAEVASLREEVARLSHEREELADLARRLQTDFDNFRRRTREEALELRRTAAADLIRELLPALDNLERALAAAEAGGEGEALRQGVALTRDQLFAALAGAGLEPIRAVGQRFDPELHEALERVEVQPEEAAAAGGEPGTDSDLEVVAEFRRGYLVRGKLLRPSLVKVASRVRRD